jgi:hypothetical protein
MAVQFKLFYQFFYEESIGLKTVHECVVQGMCHSRKSHLGPREKACSKRKSLERERQTDTQTEKRRERERDCLKVKAESKPYSEVIKLFS